MSNTLPPIDLERPRMEHLLRLLSLERLDQEGAMELIPLLQREAQNTSDPRYRKVLSKLIRMLNDYIEGRINLMPGIDVSTPANLE